MVLGLIIGLTLSTIMLSGTIWAWRQDVKGWNHGICDKCYGGVWESTCCDSGGNSSFKCTNCGFSWWESGYAKKIELNPKQAELAIRSIKLKRIRNNTP